MAELRVYVVNNYGQFCHLIYRALREFGVKTEVIKNTLTVEEILSKELDGLILSGGPTLERAGNCKSYVRELEVPILGICLGHQLMAVAYGGSVRKGKYGGFGEVEVEILHENDILKGMAPKTITWASHSDEVEVIPQNFIRLAKSEICEVEAMKHKSKPLYGVQWHPEVSHTLQGKLLLQNFLKVCQEYSRS
jgi:GMP synthase (glutamine-hydrolysing)